MKPKAEEKPLQTEDEIARQKLGGNKSYPCGKPAPLTEQDKEQVLPDNDDPGHVE